MVRSAALLVASLLGLSTGLQPILARLQLDTPERSEPARSDTAKATNPAARHGQPDHSDADGDQGHENACTGTGLGDLLDRHQRPHLSAQLGAAVADLPLQTPASSERPLRRPARLSGHHPISHEWGQRAHWPCGPPISRSPSTPA